MAWFYVFLYLLLLILAVPWYWSGDETGVWFGMPVWVCVAIVVSLASSLLTIVILRTPWSHEEHPRD